MRAYSLTHLSDAVLLRDLAALVVQDRTTTASLLAHLAEVDARRLYVPAGYASMQAYCVEELRFSDDAAYKRIQAARAVRRFPALFEAVAEGRLHLTAVRLLAPHLTAENAADLLSAAEHRRTSEIEGLVAERFGRAEEKPAPALVRALPVAACRRPPALPLAPGHVDPRAPELLGAAGSGNGELAVRQVGSPGAAGELAARQAVPAISEGNGELAVRQVAEPAEKQTGAKRYLLRVVIGESTHEHLRYAQTLLSHAVPSGDVEQVLDRALLALIGQLEKRKFGLGASRPRRAKAQPQGGRHVPRDVRRAVWERDQGRCTFVGEGGHRCETRRFLEFDHVDPVARGGRATVERMRLRCRAHNQYEAECAFGTDFMSERRPVRGLC